MGKNGKKYLVKNKYYQYGIRVRVGDDNGILKRSMIPLVISTLVVVYFDWI